MTAHPSEWCRIGSRWRSRTQRVEVIVKRFEEHETGWTVVAQFADDSGALSTDSESFRKEWSPRD
jgi:hypothetical protein